MPHLMERFECIAPSGANRTRFGEAPNYAEGLYSLGNGLYAWMVPNGSWGEANAGLIVGDGASCLIDTLWDVTFTQAMLDAMAPMTGTAPIGTLINTHADGDHFWGNELVSDAETITSDAARKEMAHKKPAQMLAFERVGKLLAALPWRSARRVGHWYRGMCAPYAFGDVHHTPARRGFTGQHTLHPGGREVVLMEMGPAHTDGDLVVHVPDAKTLFAGDLLFIDCTPAMWAGPAQNWLDALDRMLDMEVDIFIPGHGPITDKSGVAQVKAYWDYMLPQLDARFDAGQSAAHAAREIALSAEFANSPFSAWDSPERIMTNAHIHLRHRRGVSTHPGPLGILDILRKQALLAHEIPGGRPKSMRT